jgi:hypothetical protein
MQPDFSKPTAPQSENFVVQLPKDLADEATIEIHFRGINTASQDIRKIWVEAERISSALDGTTRHTGQDRG